MQKLDRTLLGLTPIVLPIVLQLFSNCSLTMDKIVDRCALTIYPYSLAALFVV